MLKKAGRVGFTLVEIMIVVTIVGMLAALALPAFSRARNRTQQQACISIIRSIDGAKQQWALENYEPEDAAPTPEELDPYIKGGTSKCVCPADPGRSFDTLYALNSVSIDPMCKIKPTEHKVK